MCLLGCTVAERRFYNFGLKKDDAEKPQKWESIVRQHGPLHCTGNGDGSAFLSAVSAVIDAKFIGLKAQQLARRWHF